MAAAVQGGSKTTGVVAAVSTLLLLAAVLVGLRLYTRAVILKTMGHDDWATVVALLLTFTCGIVIAANTMNGLGTHIEMLGPETMTQYMETFYISIVFYNASLMAIKISFLLQYYRVFTVRYMRRTILSALVVIGCWCVSQLLISIFNCQPVAGFWDITIESKCIPSLPFWYINAAGNIATDVAIFVLPLPVIGGLKLPRSQKLILIGIFSLGLFTCAISVIRIQFLRLTEDFTYENADSAIWSVAELCCGITCICLPTLRPLVDRHISINSSRQSHVTPPMASAYARPGGASSRATAQTGEEEEKAHTEVRSRAYRGESSDSGIDDERIWRAGEARSALVLTRATVATDIKAGLHEPLPSLITTDRQIEVRREVHITQSKAAQ